MMDASRWESNFKNFRFKCKGLVDRCCQLIAAANERFENHANQATEAADDANHYLGLLRKGGVIDILIRQKEKSNKSASKTRLKTVISKAKDVKIHNSEVMREEKYTRRVLTNANKYYEAVSGDYLSAAESRFQDRSRRRSFLTGQGRKDLEIISWLESWEPEI